MVYADRVDASGTEALRGLIAEDPADWARRHGAELVAFDAPRGDRVAVRAWLLATAAIEGRSGREAEALVDAVLRKAGLEPWARATMAQLAPLARASVAVAEIAVAIAGREASVQVVVPSPPLAWPERHELRRLATWLLAGASVTLHAFDAVELAPLVPREAIVDAAGRALWPADGRRVILARVYAWGEAYDAFRKALDERGVRVEGGPVAHVLDAPASVTARDVLAAAYDAEVDVLEVREALL